MIRFKSIHGQKMVYVGWFGMMLKIGKKSGLPWRKRDKIMMKCRDGRWRRRKVGRRRGMNKDRAMRGYDVDWNQIRRWRIIDVCS